MGVGTPWEEVRVRRPLDEREVAAIVAEMEREAEGYRERREEDEE
ncbi:hypothetical protein [Tsukamurella soli]|uniref:Uncharacterized protein n=1 Tax=Tsukamurella soli TaxID=644556 RepID=A0ABP8JQM9_9ACTN